MHITAGHGPLAGLVTWFHLTTAKFGNAGAHVGLGGAFLVLPAQDEAKRRLPSRGAAAAALSPRQRSGGTGACTSDRRNPRRWTSAGSRQAILGPSWNSKSFVWSWGQEDLVALKY